MNVKTFIVCVVVVALAGCAGNPLKPPRPNGMRFPVNVTPPAVVQTDSSAVAASTAAPPVIPRKPLTQDTKGAHHD